MRAEAYPYIDIDYNDDYVLVGLYEPSDEDSIIKESYINIDVNDGGDLATVNISKEDAIDLAKQILKFYGESV